MTVGSGADCQPSVGDHHSVQRAQTVDWLQAALNRLAANPVCGYKPQQAAAGETTALASIALAAHNRLDAARIAADHLVTRQSEDGAVPVRDGLGLPGWPTSLAVIAWQQLDPAAYAKNIQAGTAWMLSHQGDTVENGPEFGHDTTIAGWPWAEGTHSWSEPTGLYVLGLKAVGLSQHARTREGVRMLLNRILPGGGSNYGNTYVLGQLLRSHVQPTGVVLTALQGELDDVDQLAKSVAWLRRNVNELTTPSSLAWAIIGSAAQGATLPDEANQLERSAAYVDRHDQSPQKYALLALAALGRKSPFVETMHHASA